MSVETRVFSGLPLDDHHAHAFTTWLAALEARHLADLRFAEVTRALRALSSAYVERRHEGGLRSALDSRGKRAAFALFYGPLHFLATYAAIRALESVPTAPAAIVDAGCGTGAAGAAFALAAGASRVNGIDRHPWAVEEATWTYRRFGLAGRARQGDLERLPRLTRGQAVVVGYVLNELTAPVRRRVIDALMAAARQGVPVLALEPVARRVAPWWPDLAARVAASGGRADEWRFRITLPGVLSLLDRAAGLDHRELTVRTIYCSGPPG